MIGLVMQEFWEYWASLACMWCGCNAVSPDLSCADSALQDRRFEPMAHREVASLSCTVSLLCAFERAKSWRDWSIGVHGLIIEFFGEPSFHLYLCPSVLYITCTPFCSRRACVI